MTKIKPVNDIITTELNHLKDKLDSARWQFEATVECAALEVTAIAKEISHTLGEVSYEELQNAIIKEFTIRIIK